MTATSAAITLQVREHDKASEPYSRSTTVIGRDGGRWLIAASPEVLKHVADPTRAAVRACV